MFSLKSMSSYTLCIALLASLLAGNIGCTDRKYSKEEKVAVNYLNAWTKKGYDEMWQYIDHNSSKKWWPSESSCKEFKKMFSQFPISIHSPKLIKSVKEGNLVNVLYSVKAPALGCISLILLREEDPGVYPYLLSKITNLKTHNFGLTIQQAVDESKIIFDTSDFYVYISGVDKAINPLPFDVLYEPGPALFASVNTILAYKYNYNAEEWINERAQEAEKCFEGQVLIRPEFGNAKTAIEARRAIKYKLGLSLDIPDGWRLLNILNGKPNIVAIGNDEKGGIGIIITRLLGKSMSKQYPNLPREGISLTFAKEYASRNKFIKIDHIIIMDQQYYYGVSEAYSENQVPVRIIDVLFWDDKDLFEIKTSMPSASFEEKEQSLKKLIETVRYAEK